MPIPSRLVPTAVARAVLLTLSAAMFARAGAQDPRPLAQPESVPYELAAALAAAGGLGGDPQILIGSLPEFIVGRAYVPAGGRVVGSAFLGNVVVGIIAVLTAPDSAVADFRRELMRRGWKAPPPPPSYGGGFRPAQMQTATASSTSATLCGEQQQITVSGMRKRGGATHVTLRIFTATTAGVCNPPQPPVFAEGARPHFPTLFNPPDGSDPRTISSCYSSMTGTTGASTMLRTPMTSEAVIEHYGRQLQDSGWTAAGERAVIGRTWTRPDSTGAPIELTLTVAPPNRDAACREVNLRVRTTPRR